MELLESSMWDLLGRVRRTVSDFTFGTVIVLVHVAIAARSPRRADATKIAGE